MSTRYELLLQAVKTALAARAPGRVVTRAYESFENRAAADLDQGIYSILPGPIGPYPYEVSDHQGGTDSLRATQCARMRISIVGQLRLAESATGEDVDAAEFAMLAELEQLADDAIETDTLMALKLVSARPSQQAEKPYAWIHTEWEVFSLD